MRAWIGACLVIAGAVLLVLGWYEIAGETLVARQLPFVASASIPGAALLIAGAVMIGSELARGSSEQAEAMVAALYRLLTEEPQPAGGPHPAGEGQAASDVAVVAVPGGTRYHRRDCPLVQGKPEVATVDRSEVERRAMQPCPVCGASLPEG